jgi:hypothetical protein
VDEKRAAWVGPGCARPVPGAATPDLLVNKAGTDSPDYRVEDIPTTGDWTTVTCQGA